MKTTIQIDKSLKSKINEIGENIIAQLQTKF